MEEEQDNNLHLITVSGMSGAGKTTAVQALEDLGYFTVDNLPPKLVNKFLEIAQQSDLNKVALVVDLRSKKFFDDLKDMMLSTRQEDGNVKVTILYLDASNQYLVTRYKQTRRKHPLLGSGSLLDAINQEREKLTSIKQKADVVINTDNLNTKQLRKRIFDLFGEQQNNLRIELMSFGYKYGLPVDADIVMDVRFLPNPYYIDELKNLTGLDQSVYDYVISKSITVEFCNNFLSMLKKIIPRFREEGRTSLNICIGCTGGQHRSVAITEKIGHELSDLDCLVNINHRDIEKRNR